MRKFRRCVAHGDSNAQEASCANRYHIYAGGGRRWRIDGTHLRGEATGGPERDPFERAFEFLASLVAGRIETGRMNSRMPFGVRRVVRSFVLAVEHSPDGMSQCSSRLSA